MESGDEDGAAFDRLPIEFLDVVAKAIVWPPYQSGPPAGEHFHIQVARLDEILESRLLSDVADLPRNDLLFLRLLLRLLDRRVGEIRENWDELRSLSDLFE